MCGLQHGGARIQNYTGHEFYCRWIPLPTNMGQGILSQPCTFRCALQGWDLASPGCTGWCLGSHVGSAPSNDMTMLQGAQTNLYAPVCSPRCPTGSHSAVQGPSCSSAQPAYDPSAYMSATSRVHADHYTGLNENWSAGVIYCSPITAALAEHLAGVPAKYLQPLQLNTPCTIEGEQRPLQYL